MKRDLFEKVASGRTDVMEPLTVTRLVSRSGRSLAVLLDIQDEPADAIRFALEAPGPAFHAATLH